ncbi:MAG: U32 family peptidase C-terminal domain-containing protein [Parcubacteria group bacterium]
MPKKNHPKIELLAPAGLVFQSKRKTKIELLAPAGNLEKLKYAIAYGADAVYAGVPDFSLRVRINNFTPETLREAVEFTHKHKKKIYITLNIYAHNGHLENIKKHLGFLKTLDIDGVIVADPGVIMLVKKYLPKTEIHLSTQANATNAEAVKFWAKAGVKRVVLAREVTLEEIREIKKAVPKMELEYFVHGAMCMGYSGRCILSKWMSDRSANLGDCTQPCRWKYARTEKIYETSVKDDMERFEVDLEEDRHGTYFFNSRDLNLSGHIRDLVEAGVDSLKIEGRAKSVYYVSTVVGAYCKIISALGKKNLKQTVKTQQKELDTLVNRGYSKGFLLGNEPEHNFEGGLSGTGYKFVGQIEGRQKIGSKFFTVVFMHNGISLADKLELVSPSGSQKIEIKKILNHKMEEVAEAHGGHDKRYFFDFGGKKVAKFGLLRKNGE